MSRIGKAPVIIPAGVTVKVENNTVFVKGPKGQLSQEIHSDINVAVEDVRVVVTRPTDDIEHRAHHGLVRALIHNMVVGVEKGYSKNLVINGVGYKAVQQGDKVVLTVGYSHTVDVVPPAGLKLEVVSPTEISVKGIDKELVGQFAADIKAIRKPEPYHGYGIRYKDETILRKEGKTAGK